VAHQLRITGFQPHVDIGRLVAYSVSHRTREIGIRMAIGADRVTVIRMILREGFVLGAIGVTVGLVLAVLACRLVTSGMMWIATFRGTNPLLFAERRFLC
jgi:ABC-type antimicrobial peptide transport system permease subunit